MPTAENIVYIGSAGVLSEIPLRVLLQQGINIGAIALLASTRQQLVEKPATLADIRVGDDESLSSSASLLEIAKQYDVDVIVLDEPLSRAARELKAHGPDLMLMSCFPRKLPAAIYKLPELGCFNLHPSLLPQYRGPSPIHWQCEHRVEQSGVSVHQVNTEFDQGDIAIQKQISTRHCVNKLELAYKLALLGGEALVELVDAVAKDSLTLTPQSEIDASYYGFPSN